MIHNTIMKILYFHQHFKTPQQGGGTRSYEFARKLIERGHSVTMVCGGTFLFDKNETQKIKRVDLDGIDTIQIRLPYSNKDGIFKRAIIFIKFAMECINISKKEHHDLLFATSTPLTAGIPGIWQKWFGRRKRKFVFEVRDLWPELPKALGMKNPIFLTGMSLLEKWSYKYADGCIGLSPGICDGIKKRSPKGRLITMIPNGCDLDLFVPGKRENLELKGISAEDKVAVFTGAHGVANGLDAILDMAQVLKQRGREDIKIAFIGDGKMKPHLQERAQRENLHNCLFFNRIPKTELTKIVSSADIGLMVLKNVPAFYYGTSPNKFFDYISSGLPIINNYLGWLADMIEENNCGLVVNPDSPEEFADALIKLADNPELRRKQGVNARALAVKSFNREMLANQFVDFLETIYQLNK